ncbi:unnamed protein product [Lampetra fluviatilis]
MLPSSNQPRANGRDAGPATACFKRSRYLRRLLRFRQMDFEFATWQMLYLFTAPQKVYRNFHYRKQTKDQWARDDPAFLVLLSVWLCVSTLGFGFVLSMSFLNTLKLLLWVVFIDCIGVGLLISTLMWSHHSGLVHRIFRGKHTVARRHRLLHLHHLPWLQRAAIPEEHGAAAVPHGATSASVRAVVGAGMELHPGALLVLQRPRVVTVRCVWRPCCFRLVRQKFNLSSPHDRIEATIIASQSRHDLLLSLFCFKTGGGQPFSYRLPGRTFKYLWRAKH